MTKIVSLQKKLTQPRLRDVLNKLIENANINICQLSKNTGLANTTIKRMCTDPECNPTMASITRIADFFGITPSQLLGTEPLTQDPTVYYPSLEKWERVPILNLQQVVRWPNNIEEIKEFSQNKYTLTDIEVNENLFAVIVNDETLEPKFSEGTILIFDPIRSPKNKDFVVLIMDNKELPQFRQILMDGPDLYIKSINPEFGTPLKLLESSYKICGVLVQAKSNYL